MRPQTDMQSLGQLKAAFVQMGEMGGFDAVASRRIPTWNSSTTCTMRATRRASSMALPPFSSARRRAARSWPEAARAIKGFASIGSDLALMLTGPIDVSELCCARPA